MEPLSFFGRFVQKVVLSFFSDSLVRKTTQQTDGSCNVTSDSQLSKKISENNFFISANTYENYFTSKQYCAVRHDDKMCFLPNCRYHIILIGNIKDLLQKLDAVCFNYQHEDCPLHFSSTASVAKLLSRVENSMIIAEGSSFQPPKQRSQQTAQHREKETLEEKVQKTSVELLAIDQFDAN